MVVLVVRGDQGDELVCVSALATEIIATIVERISKDIDIVTRLKQAHFLFTSNQELTANLPARHQEVVSKTLEDALHRVSEVSPTPDT